MKKQRNRRASGKIGATMPPPSSQTASLLCTALLFLATLFVYAPAWHGQFIWDDDAHVTRADLRPWSGLARIWFEPGATQQYYPLVHSVFWIEHRLWGEAVLPYHLVSIALHALA